MKNKADNIDIPTQLEKWRCNSRNVEHAHENTTMDSKLHNLYFFLNCTWTADQPNYGQLQISWVQYTGKYYKQCIVLVTFSESSGELFQELLYK